MSVYKMIKDFVTSKIDLKDHKKQLKTKYVKFSQSLLTTHIMPSLNQFVRHLILEKGLDPDYVAPPPPPPPPSDPNLVRKYPPMPPPEVVSGRIMRAHTMMRGGDSQSWVGPSFKDLSKHPVMKARAAFEKKQSKPQPITVEIEEPALVPTVDELAAIEQVKVFLEGKMATVLTPEPEKLVEVVKKSRKKSSVKKATAKVTIKKAAKAPTVTKSFGGGFRRVNDK